MVQMRQDLLIYQVLDLAQNLDHLKYKLSVLQCYSQELLFLVNLGPFYDYNAELIACSFAKCNSSAIIFQFFIENPFYIFSKLIGIFISIFELPFSITLFPEFSDSLYLRLLNYKGDFLSIFLSLSKYILLIFLIINFKKIKKQNYRLILFYSILIINLICFPVLQNYLKHYFFLEIIPLFLFVKIIISLSEKAIYLKK